MKGLIKKADIVLALALLIAGPGSLALLRGGSSEGLKAVVYYEGEVIDEIYLSSGRQFLLACIICS